MRIVVLCLLAAAAAALDVGEAAPPLDGVTWVKGESARPGQGTVAVVEFWATWCGPCKVSIPHLTALQRQYGDRLVVIGLSDEERTTVEPFVAGMGEEMAYRVGVIGEEGYGAWMEGVEGIPHAFIVAGDGTVLWGGHPMKMDATLAQVMAGTFDAGQAGKVAELRRGIREAVGQRPPDVDRALALNTELLAQEPFDGEAIGLQLAIARHLQRPELARATLAAVPLDGDDAQVYNQLAWQQLAETPPGDRVLDRALAFARRAHELAPQDAAITDTWARALHEIGLIDEAIAAQEQAVAQAEGGRDDSLRATLDYYREVKRLRALGVPTATPAAAAPAANPAPEAAIP